MYLSDKSHYLINIAGLPLKNLSVFMRFYENFKRSYDNL